MELLNKILLLLIILAALCLFLMILLLFTYKKVMSENKILLQREEYQKSYITNMSTFYDEVSDIIKAINYFTAVSSYDSDTAKHIDLLEKKCVEDCQRLIEKTSVGNTIIAALLHHKQQRCIDSGINFSVKMHELPKSKIQEVELVSLLGNLLDNAIEAAEKEQDPFVEISSATTNGVWVITVSNTKSADIDPLSSNMSTTKYDATYHGMGIKIIKQIVSKYDGIINFADTGNTFISTVTIPL